MASYYYAHENRKKFSWKKAICLTLGVLVLIGAIGCIIGTVANKTKTISASAFSVGGLDENGEYIEQSNTLFTEELIECQGLVIEPDLKSTVTYQVFLYDHNKELAEVTENLTDTYKLTDTSVQYCRIMIMPEKYLEENYTISVWDIRGIVNNLTITVNRKQDFKVSNYFEADKSDTVVTSALEYEKKSGYGVSKLANVEGVSELSITFSTAQPDALEILFFTASDGSDEVTYTYVSTVTTGTESTVQTVSVPSGATHMVINYKLTDSFVITAN